MADYQLVAYDESEYFRNYDSEQFDYPFQKRKSLINTYTFDIQTYV